MARGRGAASAGPGGRAPVTGPRGPSPRQAGAPTTRTRRPTPSMRAPTGAISRRTRNARAQVAASGIVREDGRRHGSRATPCQVPESASSGARARQDDGSATRRRPGAHSKPGAERPRPQRLNRENPMRHWLGGAAMAGLASLSSPGARAIRAPGGLERDHHQGGRASRPGNRCAVMGTPRIPVTAARTCGSPTRRRTRAT